MEMTNNYARRASKPSILCVIMVAVIAFSIWHSCGYCASADDVAQIFRQNEQLFERCQSALEREPAISHIVFREGECVSDVSYYCIGGAYYAGEIPSKELANIVSELENAVPLRYIQIRDGGKNVDFILQVSNLLNAAGIWYSEDGELDTMYYDVYKDVYKRECRVHSQLVLLHNLGVI